jgi:hypothetical protein
LKDNKCPRDRYVEIFQSDRQYFVKSLLPLK